MNYLSKELQKTDSQDIDDILETIEKSFNIRFKKHELIEINSIRELCILICAKINLQQQDTCTTQQAFYKFRKAYYNTQNTTISLRTTSQLSHIFPKEQRRQNISKLEKELGFELSILDPAKWISIFLLLLFAGSILMIFAKPILGIVGILFTVISYIMAYRFASHFTIDTLKELIANIVKENYHKSRSTNSYNPKEIENIVLSFFKDELGYDDTKFDQYTIFNSRNF